MEFCGKKSPPPPPVRSSDLPRLPASFVPWLALTASSSCTKEMPESSFLQMRILLAWTLNPQGWSAANLQGCWDSYQLLLKSTRTKIYCQLRGNSASAATATWHPRQNRYVRHNAVTGHVFTHYSSRIRHQVGRFRSECTWWSDSEKAKSPKRCSSLCTSK